MSRFCYSRIGRKSLWMTNTRTHSNVLKSHSACRNHTLVRVEITVVSVVNTFVRVKITMRVEITLCVYKSHSCVSLSHSWVSYSNAYLSKLLSFEWKPHSACKITILPFTFKTNELTYKTPAFCVRSSMFEKKNYKNRLRLCNQLLGK
jgi:hypothetical protein